MEKKRWRRLLKSSGVKYESGGERGGREGGAGASSWISGVESVLSLWSKRQIICSGSAVSDGFSDGECRAQCEKLFC